MNKPGTIFINLQGVTFEETERCRSMIHRLFEEGFFAIKNGSFTANFDENGNMATIELRFIRRGKRPIEPMKILEQFKVEMSPVINNSSVARKI